MLYYGMIEVCAGCYRSRWEDKGKIFKECSNFIFDL